MHARVIAYQGVSNIDDGVLFIREKAAPVAREQKGYLGMSVSVDRSAGTVNILSNWATEQDRTASESALAGIRSEGVGILGAGQPTITNFDVLVNEVGDQPPAVGCRLRVVALEADPARIDEEAASLKDGAVPALKAAPGFRAFRLMFDRSSGRGAIGTVWADEAALQGSEEMGKERRQEASARGSVTFGEITRREIVFIDTPM